MADVYDAFQLLQPVKEIQHRVERPIHVDFKWNLGVVLLG